MTYRIVLIGCGSNKIVTSDLVAARDLYTSTYFDLKRQYAEGADLAYVLSAKYGLVFLDEAVETYDRTIDDVDEVMWSAEVIAQLARIIEWKMFRIDEWDHEKEVVVEVLAGRDYVDPLRESLEWGDAYSVRFPFDETSGIGDQMSWLKDEIGDVDEHASRDPYEERIVGETQVEIRCLAASMDLDGPEACSHETETVELDEPARKEGDRVVLPGIPLDCPECGNPGGFVVNGLIVDGIGVSNV